MKPKSLRIYETLCPSDIITEDDPRRLGIMQEVTAVCRAKTAKDAVQYIEWWGWDSPQQMWSWIHRARRMWAKREVRDER